MLSLIPIIGPIIQGIVTPVLGLVGQFFTSKVELQKSETAASVEVIQATEQDWGVRLARDLIMFPVAIWTAIISWDTVFAMVDIPKLTVARYPDSVAFLPYAVIAFLFGNAALNIWKNK